MRAKKKKLKKNKESSKESNVHQDTLLSEQGACETNDEKIKQIITIMLDSKLTAAKFHTFI